MTSHNLSPELIFYQIPKMAILTLSIFKVVEGFNYQQSKIQIKFTL